MYKIIGFVGIIALLLSGCAGYRESNFGVSEDGSVHQKDVNISLFGQSIGPVQMATAKLVDSEARLNYAMAQALSRSGGTAAGGLKANFLIGLANQDPFKDVYFYNPELPSQIILLRHGGGSYILPQSTMPGKIVIYRKGKPVLDFYPIRDYQIDCGYNGGSSYKKIFNGQKVDLRYAINKVYAN